MRVTEKGQVTIPAHIREQMGLLPNTAVEFKVVRGKVVIEKIRTGGRGTRIVDRLRGTATKGLSTEDIMALTRG